MASQPRIKNLLDSLKDTTASVYFVPDMFVTDLIQGRTDSVCGLPVISVCETPFRGPAGLLKRTSDMVLATVILLLLSPFMLMIALGVKLSSNRRAKTMRVSRGWARSCARPRWTNCRSSSTCCKAA
jgi:putative colanic acid biosynthesis UDP-glucose lipid carrier transferase